MKVLPITSQANNMNFRSKLPSIDYKYTDGYTDFWGNFTTYCINNGKSNKLKELLLKLKNNSDNNMLALTHTKKDENKSILYPSVSDIYTFSLHPIQEESKSIDMQHSVSNIADIFVKETVTRDQVVPHPRGWKYTKASNAVNADIVPKDSVCDILFKILEKLVEKGSETSRLIFPDNDINPEQLLKDFRA